MIVGGWDSNYAISKKTQIRSLAPTNHPVPSCWEEPADYPIKIYGSMGAVLGNPIFFKVVYATRLS